jgi:hypothetical protein
MTHDIRKLITGIREWERADKAYRAAHKAWYASSEDDDDAALELLGKTEAQLRRAAAWHTATPIMDDKPLKAFVALADAYEAQAAENLKLWQAYNTLFAGVWMISDYELSDSTNLREHAEETIKLAKQTINLVDAIELEDARDEFRAALTGNDEGDA